MLFSDARELQMLTKYYRKSQEKLLKSEALLTLSLKASFEANSAPTLHGQGHCWALPVFGVGALFAPASVPHQSMKWHLSRPNR